ncbi:oxygen-dependent tRNA uridine(34) hydroxylase TrhO [Corynebacterium terpenotabidum]|uniref:tRNA uridine(34) hydroxylase n=1 Tax=Corynebacterium terpenotabidum Y-11 TaxID=1200352 RepID=S4XBN8_9CORY|nr:rhodanese-related sulfurtransferase [Corynebacterium terpenotabidum]AGP29991.1 putative rhodanese-related sulfurtransferase [Corynebacterium terpenotabidum Y-11]
MSESRILLYYRFTPLADPTSVMLWQRTLCESLGLRGRIIISRHGINGTVGGSLASVKTYIRRTREYPGFHDMEFKWSQGSADDFPKLSVKVRDEIVTFGAADDLEVDENGVVGGGVHLTPTQVNELVAERAAKGEDVVFFDGRNAMEAAIGHFRDAVVPDATTTRDFLGELDSGKYDELKDRPVVTYCTGGVRCEVLSKLMIDRGFSEVYQLDGGIVRYGEQFADTGLWEGSLYVFDKRMHMEFSDDATQLGHCLHCGSATNTYRNCVNDDCRDMILLCDSCAADPATAHCGSQGCLEVTSAGPRRG